MDRERKFVHSVHSLTFGWNTFVVQKCNDVVVVGFIVVVFVVVVSLIQLHLNSV